MQSKNDIPLADIPHLILSVLGSASDADYINKCFDPCQFEVLYIVLIYLYILSYSIITISPNIRLIMYSRPLDEEKEKTAAGKQSSFIGNLMIDPR